MASLKDTSITGTLSATGAVTLSAYGAGFVKFNASGAIIMDTSTYLTAITSTLITNALGFTPYNATNPNGYITSSALSSYLPLSGGAITGTLSIKNTSSLVQAPYQSDHDFPNGAYIQTDIAVSSGEPWTCEITAFNYGNGRPTKITINGYNYAGTYYAGYAISTGLVITGMSVFQNASGYLCLYIPSQGYWNAYNVNWYVNYRTNSSNRVTSISNSTKPTGISYENVVNPTYSLDTANYNSYAPTLTGGNASGTWGISITGNSATVGGYGVSGTVGANTVVIRDVNGYIYANYINSNVSETENPTINSFYTSNGDGWLRKASMAHVKSQMGLGSNAYTSTAYLPLAGGSMTGDLVNAKGDQTDWYIKPNGNGPTIRMRYSGGTTNRNAALGWMSNTPAYSDVLYWTDSVVNSLVALQQGGNQVLHAGNYNSYSPTLTGTGASGTWGISISGNAATATSAGTSSNLYGSGGNYIASSTAGTSYANVIQVREAGLGGAQGSSMTYAPRLGFHWSGIVASSIAMEASGRIGIFNNPGTSYENFIANVIYANSSFQGNLTGNVTGNVSGNAATVTHNSGRADGTWYNVGWFSGSNSPAYSSDAVMIQSSTGAIRANIFYDNQDTGYYLDPNGTSNLLKLSEFTMAYNGMNPMSANSPYASRYSGSANYRNGTMGYGTTDFNVMFSNWGSGFIDSWSSPANAPGGSSHYVGHQVCHYNYQNSYNVYGYQMACAGESVNRFFWRSSWNVPNAWVEMIHTGNIGSQSVSYASNAGSLSSMNISQFSNNSGYLTSGSQIRAVYSSGFGNSEFTWLQTPSGLQQYNGSWASFLISNHGNGSNYYNQTIIMPFWGAPQYMRKEGNNNVGPWTFYTTENLNPITTSNIGSQSVSYATTAGSAPNGSNINNYYDSTAGNGYGFRFWNGSDTYKIHMGNVAEYHYGPVTDYSIKFNMDSNGSTRGFTWGQNGATPIASLNVGNGNMQVAGTFYAEGNMASVVAADVDVISSINTSASYYHACFVGSITAVGSTSSYYLYGQQNTSSVSLKIFTNGNIENTNNSYGAISDIRLKENIKDATPKLEDLMKVKVRNYNLIGESNKQLGVISQELEAIFPNMIQESTNMGESMKIKGVKYSVFIPMLIKAIQEQQIQIEELKNKLDEFTRN